MNVTNIIVNEVQNKGLNELTIEEKGLVRQVMEHVSNDEIAVQSAAIVKAFETNYFGHHEDESPSESSKTVTQLNRFIKFSDTLRVNLFKSTHVETGKVSYIVQGIALSSKEGKNLKQIVTTFDGEVLADKFFETDELKLDIPENFSELTEDEKGETDVKAQDLPCIQNGCCSFRYNGLPWNPLVVYNWCGANCGSGTPVNALDRCCRTHDYCYMSYGSYPGRCSCDRNLISCASNTDNAGGSRLITAFQAKMLPLC
ncbi:hypothetical protein [Rossellomorea marisflavi]|uniref:hypothetical protein n=1 Tax=Rossellomorea marisflavi TaxID=189381 RepID=UPI00064E64D0|nr:hypothetical protein [Rossellomorea marisflavi]KML00578.1 hypothetical protein VL06_20895 [Rossellomorea marisflavi]